MKTNTANTEHEESTYSMLVHEEEKKRGIFETIAYVLIILSAIAAILQFADQPDPLPLTALPGSGFFQTA
jgi:hypothetical protein